MFRCMILITCLIFLCHTPFSYVDATIPSVDFTGLLGQFVNSNASWCTRCPAFPTTCAMGCAGDPGGGNCPASACPHAYTFSSLNNLPVWNINVSTFGDPYRAFSYIPLCVNASTCTTPFVFSFSVRYNPLPNAIFPLFSGVRDYLKLLFWGDGNNILGVKNGTLLGLPNGGVADLVGQTSMGTGQAFATPFLNNTWMNIAVRFTYNANATATLAFFVDGRPIGTTTSTIGTATSGLQFGAYVWGGTFFTLQYTNIQITADVPTPISPTVPSIPSIDFNSLLGQFVNGNSSWCTACPAFPTTCAMGCAGDPGGGNCPASACPHAYTFSSLNNLPVWNINVSTFGDPYRAFSYIPLCVNPSTCTAPFVFSFSVRYLPLPAAAMPVFSGIRDYLKLLFWGDGNNILGVKNGTLLGLPNGGVADLVGQTSMGTGEAFAAPFPVNTWMNIAVRFTYNNATATLAFFVNGQPVGTTTSTIGTATTGLQFGAYVWGGTFFSLQYTNIQITANVPNPPTPSPPAPTPPVVPTIPSIDFTGLLDQFVNSNASWCTQCPAFPTTCAMGCAGDPGGGNCPASACPRAYTFFSDNNLPVWNINVSTFGDPYRAFSYIPLCVNPSTCTAPFVFSFSVRYIPLPAATFPLFSGIRDYLKILFWGDGNNILGVKNGTLLGLPNGGVADLVGQTSMGTGEAFAAPFLNNTWMNIAVRFTYNANATATLAFFVDGQPMGSTTGTIGTAQSGLQFGAYVWGGTFFTLQYTNIQITADVPAPRPTTATPTTAVPTPSTSSTSDSSSSSSSGPAAGLTGSVNLGTCLSVSVQALLLLALGLVGLHVVA